MLCCGTVEFTQHKTNCGNKDWRHKQVGGENWGVLKFRIGATSIVSARLVCLSPPLVCLCRGGRTALLQNVPVLHKCRCGVA